MNNQQPSPARKPLREWLDALLIAVIIATILRIFVVESYRIPTGSMEQTLLAGDVLFVNKYVYGAKVPFTNYRLPAAQDVERGEVIVFKFPKNRSLNFIKRCVAVGGDVLEIRNRNLFVNGKVVPLPEHAQFIAQEMPQGLGDSRIFPVNSHFNKDHYGPLRVPRKGDVIQLNAYTYPLYAALVADEGHTVALKGDGVYVDGALTDKYTVTDNYYFAMGDNRDDSLDSRFWGFVPGRDIVGRAIVVYWSWNPGRSIVQDPLGKVASIRWNRIGIKVH